MPRPYHKVLLEAVARSGRSARDISLAAVGHESAVRSLRRGLDLHVSTVATAVPKMPVDGRCEDVIFFDGVFFEPSLTSIFFAP